MHHALAREDLVSEIPAGNPPNAICPTRNRPRAFLIAIALTAMPISAFADAGTPLMWAGMLHMVFGNAIIGVFEGLILAKLFSLKKVKTVALLVAANYFSAWVGDLFISNAIAHALHTDLNNGWIWFWILVGVTYVLTLALEWPFVALCFRTTPNWLRRSLKGNLFIQTASYVLLFGWYWMASGTSIYTKLHVMRPDEMSLPESVLIYFISESDGNVYARPLSGGDNRKVFQLESTNENDRLVVRKSQYLTNSWDLCARLSDGDDRNPKLMEIQTAFAKNAVPDWHASLDPPQYPDTWFNFGGVARLGSAEISGWEFETGFWPIGGMYGTNSVEHRSVHFSFETPFGAWTIRNATQIPADKVIFQLGTDQICVFDPESKSIALLVHGRGPVAVLKEESEHNSIQSRLSK
jgi:hypothetical protein